MGDSLKERLINHAAAFDGLLSLIPAKMYYGEDTSDQWKKRKQSKEEAREAKRGRLDPDSKMNRTVKEVMDERARNKRKFQEMRVEEDDNASSNDVDDHDADGVAKEQPGEGLKKQSNDDLSTIKKPKLSPTILLHESSNKGENAKQEKRAAKQLRREEKKKSTKGLQARPAGLPQADLDHARHQDVQPSTEVDEDPEDAEDQLNPIDLAGVIAHNADAENPSSDSSSASAPRSPVFDTRSKEQDASVEPASTTTSITSTTELAEKAEKPKHLVIPKDTTLLRARLNAKIEALRAARKADGGDGQPIRTRQELIEARRAKQTQRKAHKKELRRLAKEEEDRKREEALASARNSPGSILSPLIDLDEDRGSSNFAFGRVAFADGTQMSHDLSYEKSTEKKKGPSDPKSALMKLEAQKKRLASLDEDKRKEVLEKETWLAARRRAEGEKVRDDETLLKKAVKRKERVKKKSEREWKERAKGVEKSVKERQRKREDNIRKRREDKIGGKGKKKGAASKKKNRPGFEGSFGLGGKKK